MNTATDLQLQPYVFFYGRCEEALKFYKDIFGGTYELMRVKDTPVAGQMDEGSGDRVMHASFKAPTISFMASDGRDIKTVDPDAGNVSLALSTTNEAEGERIFARLSQGGAIQQPLESTFWGGRLAMLHDRFGTEWIITILPKAN